MQTMGRDPAARRAEGPGLVERVTEVRAAAERLLLQARDIRADSRRIEAAGRRIRHDLAAQRERLRAGYFAIRLRRAERGWGESAWP
jgi:hypothetical protein